MFSPSCFETVVDSTHHTLLKVQTEDLIIIINIIIIIPFIFAILRTRSKMLDNDDAILLVQIYMCGH